MNARLLLAAAIVLPLSLAAHGASQMWRGTVQSVTPADAAKGTPAAIQVLLAWDANDREDVIAAFPLTDRANLCLDGERLAVGDAAAKVKPGFLIKGMPGIPYARLFSRPDLLPRGAAALQLNDACYLLRLSRAIGINTTKSDQYHDLVLHVAVRGGKVERAVATCPANSPVRIAGYNQSPFHDVDFSRLSMTGGHIAGDVAVTLRSSEKREKASACLFRIEAEAGQDGVVTGGFTGRGPSGIAEDKVSGAARVRPAIGDAYTVWLRLEDALVEAEGAKGETVRLVFKRRGQEFVGEHVAVTKTWPSGKVDSGDAAVKGDALAGEVVFTTGGKTYKAIVSAPLIGDLAFGTFRLTGPDGATREGRLRGQVLAFDAPNLAGWKDMDVRKEVDAGRFPE